MPKLGEPSVRWDLGVHLIYLFGILVLKSYSVSASQANEKADMRKQAEVVAFERQNNAVASTRTSAAILNEFKQQAEHMHDRVKTMSSGFSIQANEDRARSVKVRGYHSTDVYPTCVCKSVKVSFYCWSSVILLKHRYQSGHPK